MRIGVWLALVLAPAQSAELSPAPAPAVAQPSAADSPPPAPAALAGDAKAAALAQHIAAVSGWSVTVENAHRMDGGWRGMIQIVPRWPVGRHRVHLARVDAAVTDFAAFFAALAAQSDRPLTYRWREVELRFFESVKRTTPSAYAWEWQVAYNVNGSLLHSAGGVRATLFHEVFHLNDFAHDAWSERALSGIYDALIARCTKRGQLDNDCLTSYAPGRVRVNRKIYYSFHPGEGVEEYGADLASRYYEEHRRLLLEKLRVERPFKCAAPENLKAWELLVAEFFSGIDAVGPCPDPAP
jgi:hypothetical protein